MREDPALSLLRRGVRRLLYRCIGVSLVSVMSVVSLVYVLPTRSFVSLIVTVDVSMLVALARYLRSRQGTREAAIKAERLVQLIPELHECMVINYDKRIIGIGTELANHNLGDTI